MKILLTGATGFLGYRTLEKLSADNRITGIIATGRTIKPSHYIDHPKILYHLGDLEDMSFVNTVVHNVDVIIHAAALSSPWGKWDEFYKANVLTQKNLLHAVQQKKIHRYVHISTPSLYYNGKDRLGIKESDPLPATFINAYAATKREAEIVLEQSTVPYIILRPRALTGRGDTVIMPRLIRACEEGKLRIIGTGDNIVDLTAVANVADAIQLSLFADDQALNKVYNISNGKPVLLWQTINTVLIKLGYSALKKKIPYPIIKMVAGFMEWRAKMTDYKEPALTRYGVGTLARSFTLDISRARTLLNYQPRVSTEESIEEFVNWWESKK